MKAIKLLCIGLLVMLISFLIIFLGLETYKYTGAEDLFGAKKPYDLVIKNARIIDGTGKGVFRGEIGIRKGIIIKVDEKLKADGAIIFDAAGFTVAPLKVEWSADLQWVERDLETALLRYPYYRIIIKEASTSEWIGRSVQALLVEGKVTLNDLALDKTARALITPKLDIPEITDTNSAFYWLTGWRGEILGKKVGKIKVGFPACLVVFNHREIKENQLFNYLKQEKLPPIDYLIEGTEVQSTKTSS